MTKYEYQTKEDLMCQLTDFVCARHFQSTRVALDHLESIPEKQSLMENFKDLEVGSLATPTILNAFHQIPSLSLQ